MVLGTGRQPAFGCALIQTLPSPSAIHAAKMMVANDRRAAWSSAAFQQSLASPKPSSDNPVLARSVLIPSQNSWKAVRSVVLKLVVACVVIGVSSKGAAWGDCGMRLFIRQDKFALANKIAVCKGSCMEKLASYIKENRFTQAQAASAIGCSESALSLWLAGLRKIETLSHAVAIERWTGGVVTVEDLV